MVRGGLVAVMVAGLIAGTEVSAQLTFQGLRIENRKFRISVNEYGYSDSMLDQRWGFKGREYLSGEWAGGVYYEGGNLPAMSRWYNPIFVFPDHTNAAPHFAPKFNPPFMAFPTNAYDFPVYGSTITNEDLEISIRYEMIDTGTNEMDRFSMGITPASMGGMGSHLTSSRYLFKQSYEFRNVSGMMLSNIRPFQFIHALQSTSAVYDDREYGGFMPEYRYSLTQQGATHSLHSRKGTTYYITDTLTLSSRLMPVGLEVGLFATTDHQYEWPTSGTVANVENNSFNGIDQIYTNDSAYVCGAMSFDLGSLVPGGTASFDFLLAVRSDRLELTNYPPVNVMIHDTYLDNGSLNIVAEETTDNPFVSYSVRFSTDITLPKDSWIGLPTFTTGNFPQPGLTTISVPAIPDEDEVFYDVGLTINVTF